jgi:hypothetical protein
MCESLMIAWACVCEPSPEGVAIVNHDRVVYVCGGRMLVGCRSRTPLRTSPQSPVRTTDHHMEGHRKDTGAHRHPSWAIEHYGPPKGQTTDRQRVKLRAAKGPNHGPPKGQTTNQRMSMVSFLCTMLHFCVATTSTSFSTSSTPTTLSIDYVYDDIYPMLR